MKRCIEKLAVGDVIHFNGDVYPGTKNILYYTVVMSNNELCIQRFSETPIPIRNCVFSSPRTLKIVKAKK